MVQGSSWSDIRIDGEKSHGHLKHKRKNSIWVTEVHPSGHCPSAVRARKEFPSYQHSPFFPPFPCRCWHVWQQEHPSRRLVLYFSSPIFQQVPKDSSPELLLEQDALFSPTFQKASFSNRDVLREDAPTPAQLVHPQGHGTPGPALLPIAYWNAEILKIRLLLFSSSPHSTEFWV